VIGYNRHYQASEARRSAKYIRTNHRLRWPSAFSGQRELLAADGPWICGIGRLWGATPIFWGMQRQPLLSPAPQQQVETGDQVLELLEGGIPKLLVGEQLLIVG
jgi:hypothetical protein